MYDEDENGNVSANIRDWDDPVSLRILIGVDVEESSDRETHPSNING